MAGSAQLVDKDHDVAAAAPAAPAPERLGPGRHPRLYFEGDHVILSLGEQPCLLRIQRAILNYSETFRDMFTLPPTDGEGMSDENPIHLPDDPEHFCGVLSEYYGPTLMPHPDAPSLEYVTGVLRVAQKYGFALAEPWALEALRADFSTQSRQWRDALVMPSREMVQKSIALINLAREGGLDEFLGPAFYLLCTDETWSEDASYGGMQADDAFRLMRGTRRLYRMWGKSTLRSVSKSNPARHSMPGAYGTHVTWENFIRKENVINDVITAMSLQS